MIKEHDTIKATIGEIHKSLSNYISEEHLECVMDAEDDRNLRIIFKVKGAKFPIVEIKFNMGFDGNIHIIYANGAPIKEVVSGVLRPLE